MQAFVFYQSDFCLCFTNYQFWFVWVFYNIYIDIYLYIQIYIYIYYIILYYIIYIRIWISFTIFYHYFIIIHKIIIYIIIPINMLVIFIFGAQLWITTTGTVGWARYLWHCWLTNFRVLKFNLNCINKEERNICIHTHLFAATSRLYCVVSTTVILDFWGLLRLLWILQWKPWTRPSRLFLIALSEVNHICAIRSLGSRSIWFYSFQG